jgi:hypothetical protein
LGEAGHCRVEGLSYTNGATSWLVIPSKDGAQSLSKRRGEASKHRARLGPGLRRDDGWVGVLEFPTGAKEKKAAFRYAQGHGT